MTIAYTRAFDYQDKIDNVDIVSAGGDTGLNAQFHSIEAELDTISGVVHQVNDALTGQSTQLTSLQQQVSALGIAISRAVSITPVLTTADTFAFPKPKNIRTLIGRVEKLKTRKIKVINCS